MSKSFFEKFALLAFAVSLAVSGAFLAAGRAFWALGVLTAGLWAFVNFYFLFRLIEAGFERKPEHKNRVLFYSVLKFPVLYLAGFFILKSRFFPAYSLLIGLTIFMAAFVFHWTRLVSAEGKTA